MKEFAISLTVALLGLALVFRRVYGRWPWGRGKRT